MTSFAAFCEAPTCDAAVWRARSPLAALVRGDQAAADAALAALAGREVLPFAWLALIDRILGPDGAAIAADQRGSLIPELIPT